MKVLEANAGLFAAAKTIYPPQFTCNNTDCPRNKKGMTLSKCKQREAILHTIDSGALPVWSIHLYCEGIFELLVPSMTLSSKISLACNINYHHNFHIQNGIRIYYRVAQVRFRTRSKMAEPPNRTEVRFRFEFGSGLGQRVRVLGSEVLKKF